MSSATEHFANDRQSRDTFIHEVIGVGNTIAEFVVDRGHVGGAEIHSVTDTGVIIISNQQTGKLITELVARPAQLRRLYHKRGEEPPKWLLRLAYKNNRHRYNEK
jgi:hypothetical protein